MRVEPKVGLYVTIPFQVLQAMWAGQPAPTAFGLIDVDGHGPIPAKALASLLSEYGARATWRCQILTTDRVLDLLAHSATYASIIGVGRAAHDPGYTPSPSVQALVQARTRHCTFPGCRRPAQQGDLDHVVPYAAGGPTADLNLTPLCRRHHLVKHHTGFAPTLDPVTGQVSWRTPSGHHVSEPPDTPPPLTADADLPDAWPAPPF